MPAPRRGGVAFVAGAGGFIGRHSVAALRRAGWVVAGLGTRRTPSDGLSLELPNVWFEGPITEDTLKSGRTALGEPEIIVNAAGGSSVPLSFHDPHIDFCRTVDGTRVLLEFLRSASPSSRLIHLSSAAVYGSASPGAIRESAPLAPISPYGLHKRAAEDLALGWGRLFGLEVAVVRLFSVYGPGLRKQLLWELADRLFAGSALIELGGDGRELRDFVAVDDAIRLVGAIVEQPPGRAPFVVNGGTGRGIEIRDLAERLRNAVGCQTEIVFNEQRRPGDPRSLIADVAVSRSFGFEPRISIDAGIGSFVAWVRALHAAAQPGSPYVPS